MTTTDLPAQEKGQYANVNGLNMYYEIHGSGQTLVLVHGGGSTLQTSFRKILPLLAATHSVIAVELQAHGHTADRNTPETFEQDADDIAALLQQLQITGADILGFSNGGNTAMQLAIRHPAAVRKLVLASSFFKRDGMQPGFWEFMKQAELSHLPQGYQDAYLQIKNNSREGLQAMHDRDATRMQTFKDWDAALIQSIQAPALVVAGDQDVVTPEHSLEMYRLLPHGRLAIFPANHGSYMGELMSPDPNSRVPALFVALVNEFLASPMPAAGK